MIMQVELVSKSLAFTVNLACANGRKKAVGECPQVEFLIIKNGDEGTLNIYQQIRPA